MKKQKTFRIILLILILILAFLTIRNTYSKYVTQTENTSNLDISKWRILLNNEDIRNKSDFTEDILLTYDTSEHITEGLVVPTSKGKFSLELNSTGTDLPFEYVIQVTDDKPYEASVKGITISNDSSYYLYDVTLDVTNTISTLNQFELSLVLPNNILIDNSIIDSSNSYNGETITCENNLLKIQFLETFYKDSTKTFDMKLAFEEKIEFDVSNLSLNNQLLYNPTDRIADFRITSYNLNGIDYNVPSHESKITGIVTPPINTSESVINEFTFTVEWYDSTNNVTDNFKDVEIIKNNIPATIPITLSVTQHLEIADP